ncbi:hypothetical protein EGC76_11000 [Pseudidiomarina gelatinasegens]|uniref:Uncharacterized protein n=1 Tax=Pseudidiomarina gelatinasegens TaxID=2487740 RepID=A0A443YXV9_9GAMM|nr:hypothetical protein [Pseudidiomarina gelatinasegens]RWU08866.1 hypothetical protein EGC76_11000 [Pseudidiomarina gelatinasegens]
MSKNDTETRLDMALQRIVKGSTLRISTDRKLSVRAVEEEANLGNGSCYYYPEIIAKVKSIKAKRSPRQTNGENSNQLKKAVQSRKKQAAIKEKYRAQVDSFKIERAQMAAIHHQLSAALRVAHNQIKKLKNELEQSKSDIAELRREKIKVLR